MEEINNELKAGYVNSAYEHTRIRYLSSSSIPGEYRKTDDDHDGLAMPTSNRESTNSTETVLKDNCKNEMKSTALAEENLESGGVPKPKRERWGNDVQFLMSCIALSVGLGNIWRFPFTALDNGGGAFVIPYIIVLFLVGKPIYYMEMLLGQFSSRGSVKVYDFAPIMRGIGYGQFLGIGIVTTYYATLMALTLHYFVDSFAPTLPWSFCREEWGEICINSKPKTKDDIQKVIPGARTTSAEFYFRNVVLREKDSIDDGIGYPNWTLAISLAVAWLGIVLILIKGVKSTGKASYFLALFPYAILLVLLIRSLTLPGALNGVLYFLTPQWDKLLEPKVWYAAVTQVFFSLAICFGNIITYASYNRFQQNIKRDCDIVTSLDTFTSLISGVIIFGILGNLAYETNITDIRSVVKGGPGLAFISYPDAIAKFKFVPQIFSVLFFLMLFVLGIGSNVGMVNCIITVIKDRFTNIKNWMVVVSVAVICYCLGLLYITPGGQYVLNFLDFYGASFVALVLAIFELVAVGWIYGVKQLCKDINFMLGIKTSLYYRLCWAIITPLCMTAILIYTLVQYTPLQYNGYTYKSGVYIFGWCLSGFGIGQLLIWGVYAVYKRPESTFCQRLVNSLKPTLDWGPLEPSLLVKYKIYREETKDVMLEKNGFWHRIYDNIFG